MTLAVPVNVSVDTTQITTAIGDECSWKPFYRCR